VERAIVHLATVDRRADSSAMAISHRWATAARKDRATRLPDFALPTIDERRLIRSASRREWTPNFIHV